MAKQLDDLFTWTILWSTTLASALQFQIKFNTLEMLTLGVLMIAIGWQHHAKITSTRCRRFTWVASAISLAMLVGHFGVSDDRAPAQTQKTWCGQVSDGPWMHRQGWRLKLQTDDGATHIQVFIPRKFQQTHHVPLPGAFICVDGQWRPPQKRRYPFERQHITHARATGQRGTIIATDEPVIHGMETQWRTQMAHQRLDIEARLVHSLEPDRAAIVMAMITGSKGLMRQQWRAPFDHTNTSHILAISGLHLGTLCLMLWTILGFVLSRWHQATSGIGLKRLNTLPMLLMMCCYVMLVGAPISARRALGMIVVVLAGGLFRLHVEPLRALCLTVIGLLLWSPWLIFTPGFQLSVSATMGILLYLYDQPTKPSTIKQFVGVSLSAGLATMPVILNLTHEWSAMSLLLNLIITPIVSAVLFPMMVFGVLLQQLDPTYGAPILQWATTGMGTLRRLATWSLEHGGSPWRPAMLAPIHCVGAWAAIMMAVYHHHAVYRASMWLLIAWGWLFAPGQISERFAPELQLFALPVGQGDSTLIRYRQRSVLIDAGGARFGRDPATRWVLPMLRHQGIERIDVAILTHPDMDHMQGFFAIAQHAAPRHFYYNADSAEHPGLKRLLARLKQQGTRLHPITQPETTFNNLPLTIWRPPTTTTGQNNKSLVVHVRRGPFLAALMGDLEMEGEARWVEAHGRQPVSVLKVGHHGSKTSSSVALLDAMTPTMAFVSCGRRNRYGHPHASVRQRFKQRNIKLWRTDQHGLIHITVDDSGRWTLKTLHR